MWKGLMKDHGHGNELCRWQKAMTSTEQRSRTSLTLEGGYNPRCEFR
jgi:hypothetical protein